MRFEELDARLRTFETNDDHCVLPGLHIVVRLDGRGFTRQTREVWRLDAPFDVRFRDHMLDTVEHLMTACGFGVVYGYTQSDEISLLLRRDDATFGRKTRKLLSILAGEASARFTLAMGQMACFDARICPLPTPADVIDYFRWRHEDAHRNALNAHGYWLLRGQGQSAQAATAALAGLSVADKNELLFRGGIQFNTLPAWHKRGAALYMREETRPGVDPRTGASRPALRRVLHRDLELPVGEAYGAFVRAFVC
ncbi:guanylyltransferase [Sphaerotilus montanus]|jgi:tRNA(His) 5'-end guanylyltransferase|uniref:tRNA(His) guanylyltransferase n=1 Tax=Sphaerotilus montanus TaxID=522889 RepID=A0A7Y9U668_9BURK|nr:tRNA(His) guanylyltransferase Thg1 family protein [Sphaerotilus montanus]NYG32306.1 tRNA(His) 5'-end guanylyltransferase [Sphaerotilus montanus]NZD56138.1 guanylyltransferase [Sphaerotilus montanus]